MQVYWLEQREDDVPPANDWLSARETTRLSGLHFAKRRGDWRLGRWTAKHAIASCLNLAADPQALANIEIRPTPSGAPEVFVANAPASVTISLSHRDGRALCVIAAGGVDLGCDLEVIEMRSEAFVADYFTSEEQTFVERALPAERARVVTLIWSAKESAMKALREGLRLDTRSVIVNAGDPSCDLNRWNTLQVRCAEGQTFHGWWRNTNNILRTVVANPLPDLPIPLEMPAHVFERPCADVMGCTAKTNEGRSMAR